MNTTENKNHLMIFCGEPSGDMRAASLVKALLQKNPHLTFSGIGGENLRKAGVQTFIDIKDLTVMGFTEVLKNLPRIKKAFNVAIQETLKQKPHAVIFVDYPGFNLRLAKALKAQGFKTIYYISPQIWAWKTYRVHLIKKVIDRMMVLLPFEKEFYQRYHYTADFVGHPIVDEIVPSQDKEIFLKENQLNPQHKVIGIIPGSREKEVTYLLKDMLLAARIIAQSHPQSQFLLLQAKNLDDKIFQKILKDFQDLNITVTKDYSNGLFAVDCAMVTSGTASFELGLCQTPMIVLYRMSWLTIFLFWLLIGNKIPHISLLNLIAKKPIIKELIQWQVSPKNIALEILSLLNNTDYYRSVQKELALVRSSLHSENASARAAAVVLDELSKTS